MNPILRRTKSAARAGGVLPMVLILCAGSFNVHGQTSQEGSPQGRSAAAKAATTTKLTEALSSQGVPSTRIQGIDSKGVPILCGTEEPKVAVAVARNGVTPNSLPASVRGWEVIPGIIRINSNDTFLVEVDVNSAVAGVTLDCEFVVTPVSGGSHQTLRDDGLDQDRIAGDHIWTSGLLRGNVAALNLWTPAHYGSSLTGNSNSPPGLFWWGVGDVEVQELNNETNGFLIDPMFGVMDPHIPLVTPRVLSSNIQVTAHLINIKDTMQGAQKGLRAGYSSELLQVTTALYSVVPDAFDFLTFFSSDHIESLPYLSYVNFTAGIHMFAQINFNGTGEKPFDLSSSYGSSGKLLGLIVLDAGARGSYANNATHEILHQWACYTDVSLGLNDGTFHYDYHSGAGSLLGGLRFFPADGGGYVVNCDVGPSAAQFASPMDKYMMGLIDGSAVAPIPVSSASMGSPWALCGQVISNFDRIVTIEQIQAVHGVRTPGPSDSQHDFNIGFVIESNGRFLNQTELTFFEILARYYTHPLPDSVPAPTLDIIGWPPITKFFGEGTTWKSYVLSYVQPAITSAATEEGSKLTVSGSGFPLESYTLQGSTNMMNWSTVATLRADTNGVFLSTNNITATRQFYRALWNEYPEVQAIKEKPAHGPEWTR